jgi:hypothetical protein
LNVKSFYASSNPKYGIIIFNKPGLQSRVIFKAMVNREGNPYRVIRLCDNKGGNQIYQVNDLHTH